MELQTKSGACGMNCYTPKRLPMDAAQGLKDEIWRCQFCNTRWQFKLLERDYAKFKLVKTTKRNKRLVHGCYDANYNPKHPDSIKEAYRLKMILSGADNINGDKI